MFFALFTLIRGICISNYAHKKLQGRRDCLYAGSAFVPGFEGYSFRALVRCVASGPHKITYEKYV